MTNMKSSLSLEPDAPRFALTVLVICNKMRTASGTYQWYLRRRLGIQRAGRHTDRSVTIASCDYISAGRTAVEPGNRGILLLLLMTTPPLL